MRIHINDLCFEAILGLLPKERQTPQRICVEAEIDYDYTQNNFLDYAKVAEDIKNHLCITRYELIEEALLGLETILHDTYPNIKQLHIKITKPDILSSCKVSVSKTSIF